MSNLAAFLVAMGLAVILILGVSHLLPSLPSFFYQSLILLTASTIGLYLYLLRTRKSQPEFFVQFYLGSIAIKLLAYGAYLGLIIWEDRPGALENVVFFIAVYAVFTALEVGFLWRQITR
ncbi:MAG: hypothetical protein KF687_01110 [Cyclobacteriaceae bacterium]|nr:hypothetical protein [Cyclobacteriaceae bacterium]